MAIKRYRTTLIRSNPSVIREFQIDDSRTYAELLRTIALLHGWETDSILIKKALTGEDAQFAERLTIREMFDQIRRSKNAEAVRIEIPCYNRFGDQQRECWIFRLEEISAAEEIPTSEETAEGIPASEEILTAEGIPASEKAAEIVKNPGNPTKSGTKPGSAAEPLLLWYRGLNPHPECTSLSGWNNLHYDILENTQSMDYRMNIVGNLEKQAVDPVQINRNLNYQIRMKRKPVKLDRKKADPLVNILECSKVNELKEVIGRYHLPITGNLRKSDLTERIAKAFNTPQGWDQIIREMTLKEYEAFIEICTGAYPDDKIYIKPLEDRCMIRHPGIYWEAEKLPSELMDYYAELVYQDRDTIYIKEKKIRNAFEACRILYGVFPFSQAKLITERMYPKEFTGEDIRKYWKTSEKFDLLDSDLMYSTYNMTAEIARKLYRDQEKENIPYYTPAQEELLKIAENEGDSFPAVALAEMIPQLKRMLANANYAPDEAYFIADRIYEMYQMGWNRTLIEARLQKEYRLTSPKDAYRKLFGIVEKYTDRIHRIELRGYTQKAYQNLLEERRKAMQQKNMPQQAANKNQNPSDSRKAYHVTKIYPNSPCPCGSGKKYKYCHGRE